MINSRFRYPIAENYANEFISLPMFPEISERQIEYVVSQIIKWRNK